MKEYLGDGVYIQLSPQGAIILTTEDGMRATNTIVLETEVLLELNNYLQRVTKWAAKQL